MRKPRVQTGRDHGEGGDPHNYGLSLNLPHDVPHGRAGQEAQLFVQREAAEIGLDRAKGKRRLLRIVDPYADDDGLAGSRDLIGAADHAGNRVVVVHRQIGRPRRKRHALDVELAESRAGLASVGNGLGLSDLGKLPVIEDVVNDTEAVGDAVRISMQVIMKAPSPTIA